MNRLLNCNTCDHIWTGPSEAPEEPVNCPRCDAHVCACGCGANLGTQRSNAIYKSRACAMSLRRAGNGTTRAAKANTSRTRERVGSRGGNLRSVGEAREAQESSKEKARWTLIAREHIARTLTTTGYFHADDMAPLGIPEQHCNVIGSQIASYVNRKLMKKVGERKCSHKAANGRKAAIYRITDLGRDRLVGISTGVPSPQGTEGGLSPAGTSADPGESRTGGRGEPGPENRVAASPLGECSAAKATPGSASPETAGVDAGSPSSKGAEGPNRALVNASVDPGENPSGESKATRQLAADPEGDARSSQVSMLPEPDPKAWAA